jgi:hypothetical protein
MLWGVAVAAVGLALISQMSPLPDPKVEPSSAAAAPQTAPPVAVSNQTAAVQQADKAAAEEAALDKLAAEKAATDTVVADAAAAQIAYATPPAVTTDAAPLASTGQATKLPLAPSVATGAPSLTGLDQALTVPDPEPDPDMPDPTPAQPDGPTDALLVPGPSKGQPEPARLPQIAPVADPDIVAPSPEAVAEPKFDTVPAPSPAATLKDDQPTLPAAKPLEDKLPTTVLDKTVPGVTTGQLPQIGDAPVVPAAPPPEVLPVQKFARAFENPAAKPLFVILLHDVGAAGMSRDELASLPFPVSFVIDPLATDAKQAAAAYRAAGQEVLTLANGIPRGATAEDLETTFQTLSAILPESVAVIDQAIGGFQDQRPLAKMVLPVIQGEGRGVVTYDRGLNAADQIARRNGVPAAVVFRILDAEGESKSTMRRYLDRAAFKAAQEGQVVVIGDTRAETIAAFLEWTIEGKAGTVTLAPVTAVLGR